MTFCPRTHNSPRWLRPNSVVPSSPMIFASQFAFNSPTDAELFFSVGFQPNNEHVVLQILVNTGGEGQKKKARKGLENKKKKKKKKEHTQSFPIPA